MPVSERIIQRLFAESIASQGQGVGFAVINGEGKHASEAGENISPPFLVAMKNRLGVRVIRAEDMTHLLKLLAYLDMVVYLAVENDPTFAVEIVHRLTG